MQRLVRRALSAMASADGRHSVWGVPSGNNYSGECATYVVAAAAAAVLRLGGWEAGKLGGWSGELRQARRDCAVVFCCAPVGYGLWVMWCWVGL
jgi:hypothetical protein